MRIAVVGGGAMGGLWADRLATTGAEVTIIDTSQPVVDRIRTDGLSVATLDGVSISHPTVTTDPTGIGPVDLVYFFTKAHHTRDAADTARPLLGPESTLVSLQNGWGNADTIADILGRERLVFGVTYQSARVDGPGQVVQTSAGPTVLGPYPDAQDPRMAERVAALQGQAGLATTATTTVRTEVWKKVVLNTATLPTSALTGLYAGVLGQPGPMLDLALSIARESVAVLRAAGYDIDATERVDAITALLGRAGKGKASMLQDAEARRKTEIEVINGAIVGQAARVGVEAPLNQAMVALVGGLEHAWSQE